MFAPLIRKKRKAEALIESSSSKDDHEYIPLPTTNTTTINQSELKPVSAEEEEEVEYEEVEEEVEVEEEDHEEVEVEEKDHEEVEIEEEEEEEEEEHEEVEDEEEDEDEDESSSEEEEEEKVEVKRKKDDDGSKRETVRKLLQPFGKDQLIEILKEAALKNRSIVKRINQSAELDPTHRKIFVHGLSWDSTKQTLMSVFKQYGQIEECNVVTDKVTGKSKGYGFVLFKTRDGAQKALKQSQKKIGNRMTACQLASQGPVPNQPVPDSKGRKIYVSNVGQHINPDRLRSFFAKFGEIEEGPLGYDKVTGKLKGFALFVYKTTEGCQKALEEPIKQFQGCKLQCQRAIEGLNKGNSNQIGENPVVSTGPSVVPKGPSVVSTGPSVVSTGPSMVSTGPSVVFPPNLSYAMGLNPGIMSQGLSPAVLAGQNHGLGVLYPAALGGGSVNNMGLPSSMANGLSTLNYRNPTTLDYRNPTTSSFGLGAGIDGQVGINTISPSVIGNYGSQAALQGLGAYQSAQLGQPSRNQQQSGVESLRTMTSYFRR